jgi:CRP-like cAMP-binding protein
MEIHDNLIHILENFPLCRDMTQTQIIELLKAGESEIKVWNRGEIIFREEDHPEKLFVLISGSIAISKDTLSGKRMLMMKVEIPGDLFGETYFLLDKMSYDMQAEAADKSVVLQLKHSIFSLHASCNPELAYVLQHNLMYIFAQKSYIMNKKLKILSAASIREKIVRYLVECQGTDGELCGNMNREDMADYMNVTRPSLSRELGKMQQEGILKLVQHRIHVVNQEKLEEYL